MPTVFHGTRQTFATQKAATPGTVDVTCGGGEFGRGFYTQKSRANAVAWAINRFRPADGPCVLQLDIVDGEYRKRKIKLLDLKDARQLTQSIRQKHIAKTYLHGCDVLVGPLNLNQHREQQKFESADAQNLLNGPDTTRTVN